MAKTKTEVIEKTVMYLGPNLRGGLLFKGTVFKNKLPNYIKALIEANPLLEEMFVDIEEVPDFKHKLETLGTEENRIYQNILSISGEV